MQIAIDATRCTGHGRCYGLAPGLFAADEAGNGVVLVPDPGAEQADRVRTAAMNCPERAITLVP